RRPSPVAVAAEASSPSGRLVVGRREREDCRSTPSHSREDRPQGFELVEHHPYCRHLLDDHVLQVVSKVPPCPIPQGTWVFTRRHGSQGSWGCQRQSESPV